MTERKSEMWDGPAPQAGDVGRAGGMPDALAMSLRAIDAIIAKQQEAVIELRQTMTRMSLERAEACRLLRQAAATIAMLAKEANADPDDNDLTPAIEDFLKRAPL